MAIVHDRILQIAITCDESADTVLSTALTYFRHRGKLDAADGKSIAFTAGAAAATHELELGEVAPPPTIISIASTFQA